MDIKTIEKARVLLNDKRVMTLSICSEGLPWAAPVYFVFNDYAFYFFSNENSKHIHTTEDQTRVAATIFHDTDRIESIFGFQMSGHITEVIQKKQYFKIVKLYVDKFNFLKKIFGSQPVENSNFFLEMFNSRLYCFNPVQVYIADNSKTSGKRVEIDLRQTGNDYYVEKNSRR